MGANKLGPSNCWNLRPEAGCGQNYGQSGQGHQDGNDARNLYRLFFIDCRLDGAELRDFLLFVVGEDRMRQADDSQQHQQDAEHQQGTLHGETVSQPMGRAWGIRVRTHLSAGVGAVMRFLAERTYERAAAAFLAAFAAVEALRRRLVFGGVAGASPISSAVMMLVTKSLGPWSSKSTAVRSASEAVTIPKPYTSCLMVWPSCITCTASSSTHSVSKLRFESLGTGAPAMTGTPLKQARGL